MQNFSWIEVDYSIFIFLSKHLIIGVYVDNLLIVGETQKAINQLKKVWNNCFKIRNLGPVIYYLELYIIRNITIGTIFFFQETYIQKILEHFGI